MAGTGTVDTTPGAVGAPARGGRAGEHRAIALRASTGSAGTDASPAPDGWLRARGDRRPLLPRRAGPPDRTLEPQRAPRPTPSLRLGHYIGRRHQAGAQGVGRDLQ